jgi:glycosyltransferase involved in cell wall biosynthesis
VRVALVHDWLTGMRGGEKVLEAICDLYPDAPLYTLVRIKGSVSPAIESHPIYTSWVQRLPSAGRFYRHYLPLFPAAVESFNLDGYDLIISSSHCAVKSVVRRGGAIHICYCHSPMRYAWDQFDSYFGPAQVGRTRSELLRPVLARLARWDRDTAGRVDRYVANSHYVAGRIRRYYNRGSTVVYPPVDTTFYRPNAATRPEPFFLVVSALVPYKRLDVAIQAAAQTHVPLTIVGRGPEEARLRRLAESSGASVEFTGWLRDEDIRDRYQRCRAALMPGVEDFGMVPVEAQACGRPVIAFAAGGALESIVDNVTGILVRENTADAFAAAMTDASTRTFDSTVIRRHAESFGKDRFKSEFAAIVESECRSPGQDPRDVSARRSDEPDAVSNAARFAQRPRDFAARDASTGSASPRASSRGEDKQ